MHNAIGTEDGVMDDMRAPSVTVLYAVTIYGITRHILTHEDAVVDDNGVVGMGSSTSHTGSTSDDGGVKAFAARKGKDDYNHTQCQGGSQ